MEDDHDNVSLKHRRKKSSLSLSGCFNRNRAFGSFDWSTSAQSSSCFKSKGVDSPSDIKPRSRWGRHRRHSSDFSYDPLSYALNFEEDVTDSEEVPVRTFTSRLPTSPPKKTFPSLNQRLDALDLGRRVEPPVVSRTKKPKAKSEAPTPRSPLSPSSTPPSREIFVQT